MRFRIRTLQYMIIAVLALVSGFIVRLMAQRQLTLYIHPRYVWFAATMAGIAVLVITGYALTFHKQGTGYKRVYPRDLAKVIPVCLLILCILLSPQRSLSSDAATRRGLSQASIVGTSAPTSSSLNQFSTDFGNLSLHDWDTILNSGRDARSYVGKQATISGFIAAPSNTDANSFYLSRFFVTCCAVDATPIGIKIILPNWLTSYKEGLWLRVNAVVQTQGTGYILKPTSVHPIPVPEQPYAN